MYGLMNLRHELLAVQDEGELNSAASFPSQPIKLFTSSRLD